MKKNQLISLLVFLIIIVGIIITLLLVSYFVPIKQERGCNVQGPFTCKEVKVFTQEQLDQQNYVLLEATDVQELRIIPESIRMSTCINAYLDQSSLINSGNKEVKIILECPIGVENETIIGSLEILYMTLKGDVKKAKLMFNVRRVKPLVKRIADDFVEGIVKITKAGSNTGSRGGGGGGGGVEPLPIILGLDSENPLIIAAGQSYNIGDLVNTFYFILGEDSVLNFGINDEPHSIALIDQEDKSIIILDIDAGTAPFEVVEEDVQVVDLDSDETLDIALETGINSKSDKYLSVRNIKDPDIIKKVPIIQIVSPTEGQVFNTASIVVSGTARDGVKLSYVSVKVNGVDVPNPIGLSSKIATWETQVTLVEGTNVIEAQAFNVFEIGSAVAKVNVNFNDTTPIDIEHPTISVIHSPDNPTHIQQVIITATASDVDKGDSGISEIRVYVDDVLSRTCAFAILCTLTSCTCATTSRTYSVGTHNYSAVAVDGSDNSNTDPSPGNPSKSFTVTQTDTQNPIVAITYPEEGDRFKAENANIIVRGTASDDIGVTSVRVRLNNEALWSTATGTNPWSIPVTLIPGTNIIEAQSFDASGKSSSIAKVNVELELGGDETNPIVNVTHSPSNPIPGDTVTLTATATDASGISQIRIYSDGLLKRTCTSSPCAYSGIPPAGPHTYYADATDSYGNIGRDPLSGTKSFIVIAPTVYALTTTVSGSGTININPPNTNCGTTCKNTYSSGTSVALTATPGNGYNFVGWSGACSNTGVCTLIMNSNRSATATFGIITSNLDVSFTPSTLPNGASTSSNNVSISANIINSQKLKNVNFVWDSNSYSFYDPTLVLMFNFENLNDWGENSTLIKDASIYGQNGACWNVTQCILTTGVYGGGIGFTGKPMSLNVYERSALQGMKTYTVEYWFKKNNNPSSTAIIVGLDGYSRGWRTGVTSSGSIAMQLGNATGNNIGGTIYSNTIADNNQWYHVASTYDGSTMKLYINGVQQTETINSVYGTLPRTTIPLEIGSQQCCGAPGVLNGTVDELRIWNRSLTAEEIKQHYYGNLRKTSINTYLFEINEQSIANGTHIYSVNTNDDTRSASTETRTITIGVAGPDTIVPTVSVSHSPTNPKIEQPVVITANASDVNTGNSGIKEIRVYVDGTLSRTCTFSTICTSSSCTCATPANDYYIGTHYYYVSAIDGANNNATTTTKTFSVAELDTISPNISASHSPTNPLTTDSVTITASASDVGLGDSGIKEIKIYVDYILAGSCTFNPVCTSGACICATMPKIYLRGTHTYYAIAVDGANNTKTVPDVKLKDFTVRSIDEIDPTVSVSHSPSNPNQTQPVTITANANDANGIKQIQIYVDNVNVKTCTSSPCVYTKTFALGTYEYYATALDNYNNMGVDPSVGTKRFVVTDTKDTIPPTIAISSPTNWQISLYDWVSIRGNAFDNLGISDVILRVNNQKWFSAYLTQSGTNASWGTATGSYPFIFGNNTIEVIAIDTSGLNSTTAKINVIYNRTDFTAPTISVSHSPSNPNQTQLITITATASDVNTGNSGIDRVEIYFDGNKIKECDLSDYYCNVCKSNLCNCTTDARTYPNGPHTYYAKAFDFYGISNTSETKSFTVQHVQLCVANTLKPGSICLFCNTDESAYDYYDHSKCGTGKYCNPLGTCVDTTTNTDFTSLFVSHGPVQTIWVNAESTISAAVYSPYGIKTIQIFYDDMNTPVITCNNNPICIFNFFVKDIGEYHEYYAIAIDNKNPPNNMRDPVSGVKFFDTSLPTPGGCTGTGLILGTNCLICLDGFVRYANNSLCSNTVCGISNIYTRGYCLPCTPNTLRPNSECSVCNVDGRGYHADNDKCSAGKICNTYGMCV
ncbi:MAG: Ig-like domain-containing protein [Nanoarchaeota archaeon]